MSSLLTFLLLLPDHLPLQLCSAATIPHGRYQTNGENPLLQLGLFAPIPTNLSCRSGATHPTHPPAILLLHLYHL
ncbi:hypothetical protein B0H65DRAFT_112971 [Neurospora tetraspora]|uniref:Secreted protein n=1 Tax=Neurospora tetraspora TaxID=94610 RepID=A0AAE0JK73_9PEZI|nr:hypothetical protein B0H65DRAFT_112971 [Neurospora tetraspora]